MTSLRLLKNGIEAFPAMFAAIDGAQTSICAEMYIVADDETGRDFRTRLAKAAERGVQISLLLDAWGCWNLPNTFWDDLRKAGADVRAFRPLRGGFLPFRNHRKLLLVDDRNAYLGGMNIADEYYRGAKGETPWRDNMLEISGEEVLALRDSFHRMQAIAGSPLQRFLSRLRSFRLRRNLGGGVIRFLESGPESRLRPVRRVYRRVIRNAGQSIDLAMGYFYPHGTMLRMLKRAVKRGVRVRLMVPLHTDVPIARWAARRLYGRLLRAGVEIWEYLPSIMHSKLVIADDTVIAGSANLDIRSGRFNFELVAIVHDGELAKKARMDFEDDLGKSVRISLAEWKQRPFIQKVKEWFSYCLLARADVLISRREDVRKMS